MRTVASPPQTLTWDVSSDVWAGAYDRYHGSMADLYDVTDVPDGGRSGFINRTSVTLFENGTVGRGRSVAQTMRRTSSQIRRSSLDAISIIVNATDVVGDCDGASVRARAGAVQFRDLARPSSSRVDRVDVINLMAPRETAPAWLLDGDLHGLVLEPDSPVGRLLASHLSTLADVAASLTAEDGAAAIEAAFLIVGRAAGRAPRPTARQTEAIYRTVRQRASQVIERRLLDPVLTVDDIAVEAGTSRAALYRAFADHGGVQRRVQNLRLDRARAEVRRRVGHKPTVSEIAYQHGFASAAHFSRLFRARFGHSPREASDEAAALVGAAPGGAPDIAHGLIVDWLRRSPGRAPDGHGAGRTGQ